MIKIKKKIIIFLITLLLLSFNLSFSAVAAQKIVAVTILPQVEMVEAIAGDKVEVVEMIPKGFSPSNYAPSPSEMRAFNEASIYFSIGVPADMQNILPRAVKLKDLQVVKLFKRVESKYEHRYFGSSSLEDQGEQQIGHQSHQNEQLNTSENKQQEVDFDTEAGHSHAGGRDPHFWLSPVRTAYMVEIMRDELIKILPEYQAEFKQNAKKYLEKLAVVDQENKKLLEPYQGESILVYHPSFGYFTDHYGLKMMAIEKEGKEPGPRHLQEIIENAAQKQISSVFYQAEIDSRKTRAVAESLGGKTVQLNPLAEDYLDNLKLMAQKIAEELEKRDEL